MRIEERTTRDGDTQIFEIIENRRELRDWIRTTFCDSLYSEYRTGIWEDADSSVYFYDKDGRFHGFNEGDEVRRFNVANIARMVSCNSATTVIYGDVRILQNEHYGDWETDLD